MAGDIRKNILRAKMRYRIMQRGDLFELINGISKANLGYSEIDYARCAFVVNRNVV
jgi:hypothetical protein